MTQKTPLQIVVRNATAKDFKFMDQLADEAFGPGGYTRTAFRLREGVPPMVELCFVAEFDKEIVGSVRLTPIKIGGQDSLILGPLVAAKSMQSIGIGRELMNRALSSCKVNGHKSIILVGDLAYYKRFGFKRIKAGQISLPGPVDPARLLGLELVEGALEALSGTAQKALAFICLHVSIAQQMPAIIKPSQRIR
ncbi:MAG: GNAT family N-acetyltransferase [Nitratireductor sp.]